MRRRLAAIALLAWATCAFAETPLDHSAVGVYGTRFDFCDYSVYKFIYKDPAQFQKSLPKWRQRLSDTTALGKRNLVLLYTFDRVKHAHPIAQYIRDTDTVLRALDLKTIYALCLSEENVTWNNGLQVLNALYDYIKANYHVQVYQWLTMPDIPHPKLHADGWIIDPYGFDRVRFRRYLQKYLATGRPVIDCIWASPPHSGLRFDETPQQQVDVCREFNVPMFFYCVDTKWGSPNVWLRSNDPDIVTPREWVMGVVNKAHQEGARGLPLESANNSMGQDIEVSGDERGVYEYLDAFATEDFLDDAGIRGFFGLAWDGEKETLACDPARSRLPAIELLYHFRSPFRISEVKAELVGSHEGPATTRLGISENGHQWTQVEARSAGKFSLTAVPTGNATFSEREIWVRVTVGAPSGAGPGRSILDYLRVSCRTAAPERREVKLEPDVAGNVRYVEDFASRKYVHLAEVQGADRLEWKRGGISTHGVKGRVNTVALTWKFVSDKPLHDLSIVVQGMANTESLGAANTAGLSLDGKTILVTDTTAGKNVNPRAQGWCKEPLTLDPRDRPEFSGIRQFHLHVVMSNNSAAQTAISNRITKLEVSATAK
jgi:hypothetical protein